MSTFAELVAARKQWIERELKPWCARASVAQLKLAEQEWLDIAGKVDPEVTLWAWAWCRFPDLVNAELNRIDETNLVTVALRDGRKFTGFPDARQSKRGELVLVCKSEGNTQLYEDQGPFSLDEVASVKRA